LRNELLESEDVSARIADLRAGVVTDLFRQFVPEESVEEQWDIAGLANALRAELGLELPLKHWLEKEPELHDETLLERIIAKAQEAYDAKVPESARASFRQYERYAMLQVLDAHYREHLASLDHLRQGIHLRGYAQKNPKQEYKREAFELFGAMLEAVKLEVIRHLTWLQIKEASLEPDDQSHVQNVQLQHADQSGLGEEPAPPPEKPKQQPVVRHSQKIGRNDPCPCGSGKKYKHCHGKLA
ncbi:MAG: SEC-C metal-binding domain-containing protein, partial [Pseudomonadota bacterium]